MQPEPERLTFEDYVGWDDDQRWELIAGQPYAMASPTALHQAVLLGLTLQLGTVFSGNPCKLWVSPFDVKLSENDVVQPDLLVVCDPMKLRATHLEGVPDLVIEILSPSTLRHDRVRKLNLYGQFGVPEYWMVHPHPFVVEVMSNREGVFSIMGAYTEVDKLTSPRLPELHLDLKAIFASLPPQPPLDEVREGTPPYAGRTQL